MEEYVAIEEKKEKKEKKFLKRIYLFDKTLDFKSISLNL